jgi:hypothetical protein
LAVAVSGLVALGGAAAGLLLGSPVVAVAGGLGLAALLLREAVVVAASVQHTRAEVRRVHADTADLAHGITGLRAELTAARAELTARLDETARRVADGPPQVADRMAALERELAAVPDRVSTMVGGIADRARGRLPMQLHNELYAKVTAHADLLALIRPRAPMPTLGGWALNADVLHAVAQAMWERRPKLIVECGSGSSTVWLGYLAEKLGLGPVVALEHHERYHRLSSDLVRLHELERLVHVRLAPLRPFPDGGAVPDPDAPAPPGSDPAGGRPLWYAPQAWQDLDGIGLLVVDGPPGATGPQARYPAGPALFPRCAPDAVIVLDDTHRSDEQAVSDRWLADRPELTRMSWCRGGAHVLYLRPA